MAKEKEGKKLTGRSTRDTRDIFFQIDAFFTDRRERDFVERRVF